MSKTTILALSAAAAALATAAAVLAEEYGIGPFPDKETTDDTPAPTTKRRGRPAKEEPTDTGTHQEAEPAKSANPAQSSGSKTYEDLRAVIKGPVEDGKSAEVTAVIKKYAPGGGGLKELAGLPQHHAAFEKDIQALTF